MVQGWRYCLQPINYAALFNDESCRADSHVLYSVELYHLPDVADSCVDIADYTGQYDDDENANDMLVIEAIGYVAGDCYPRTIRL
jgi:hypothetical protein